MSAQEIIAQLPNLTRPELEDLDARLHELLQGRGCSSAGSWGQALMEIAGTAQDLPGDFAHNHDHYLHGAPRR
jgi:hypothetical protein